jgi:DNA-binding response OmpR family regulator
MRLLLVERDRAWGRTLTGLLRAEGFVLDVAADSGDGDQRARSGAYDAILFGVPGGGAGELSVLRRWRRDGLAAPVLALEGSGTAAARARALDAGADDALSRPFPVRELVARLRTLLRRTHQVKDSVLRIHDLEIDTAARAVRRGGRTVALTPREYALLEFLAFHRGRAVSRPMIWEHLYDEQGEGTSNVVDVYIGYLRAKIDKGFDLPLILTRWGYGYLLRGSEPALVASRD